MYASKASTASGTPTSPEVLAAAFDAAGTPMAVVDAAGRIGSANAAAGALLGRLRDSLPGLTLLDLLHPDDAARPVALAALGTSDGGAGAGDVHARVLRPDGEVRWLVLTVSALPGQDGTRLVQLRELTGDPTPSDGDSRFRLAFDSARVGMGVVDLHGRFLTVNAMFCALLGRTSADILRHRYVEFVHPEDRKQAAVYARSLLKGTGVGSVEVRFVRPDGDDAFLLVTANLVLDAEGTPLEYFVQATDISVRRRNEERLARRADRDRVLAAVSRVVTDAGPDHQAIVDTVARLAAELVGDGCVVRLLDDDGRLQGYFGVSHRDPKLVDEVVAMLARTGPSVEGVAAQVVATGRSLLLPVVDREHLPGPSSEHIAAQLRRLPFESLIVSPLRVRGRTVGFMTVSRDSAARAFTAEDVGLVEEIAGRTATAIDHARLFEAVHAELDERRAVEAALRESEVRFRTLVQQSFDVIVVIGRDGVIRYVSPSIRRLLGREPEEFVGGRADGLLHPRDRARLPATDGALAGVGAGGAEQPTLEFRARHADGSYRYLEAVYNDAGREGGIDGVVAVVRDITSRRRAEEATAELAAIVESSPDAIVGTRAGVITSWNRGAQQLYGYTAEEAVGQPAGLIVPEDKLAERAELGAAVGRGELIGSIDTVRITKDGRRVEVSLTPAPIYGAGGEVVGASSTARDIADRLEAEASLRRSEELFRMIFERAPIGMCLSNPDGRLVRVNDAGCTLLGRTETELVVGTVDQITHPDDVTRVGLLAGRVLTGSVSAAEHEQRYVRPDGKTVVAHVRTTRVTDGHGEAKYLLWQISDITAQRQEEADALARAAKQAGVVELGRRALSELDSGVLCQDAATTVANVLGLEWARVSELMPGGNVLETRGLVGGLDRGDGGPALDTFDPRAALDRLREGLDDRLVEHASGVVSVLLGSAGRPFGVLQAAPVAGQRPNEDDLLFLHTVASLLAAAIERSRVEQELRLVVEGVAEYAMFLLDPLGRVATWNSGAERFTGRPGPSVLGEEWACLFTGGHDGDAGIDPAGLLQAAVRNGQARQEVELVRADGVAFPADVAVAALRNRGSGVHVFSVVARDLTGWHEMEEQLRQSQKMQALGRLVGGIAHDFNNILTAIVGYTEIALDQLPAGDRVRADLEHVADAGERAAALVSPLLAFSRSQVLRPVIVDVNQVVDSLQSLLHRIIGEQIDLVMDLDPACGSVRVDRTKLEQVILNLAINARDALEDGGRLRIATVAGRPEDESLSLVVEDDGVGMDPEVERRCFEPFFTTKPPGHGTGSGLSTVYGIVAQSGGSVRIDTAPGRGCQVVIDLPVVDGASTGEAVDGERPALPGSETLLLVEDEEPVRRLAAEALRRVGYEVVAAADGEEALEIARSHPRPIHLLVTDVVIPKFDGRELARRLQAERPELPVLYISGYAPDGMVGDEASDSVDFLQKPFSPHGLSSAVRRILDHRHVG